MSDMSDLLETFTAALPHLWMMDTARYLVAAALMTALLAVFWRAGLAACPEYSGGDTPDL